MTERYRNFADNADKMSEEHVAELQKDIMQSNSQLSSSLKILVPGTDNQIHYTRFREVLRTKQFYIIMFVDFCQSSFWTLIMLTIIRCQMTSTSLTVENSFFGLS